MMATDQMASAMRLQHVAQVKPGYFSRGRVQSVASGTYRLLQAKDVSAKAGVRLAQAVRFLPDRNPELYRILKGDILVAARGQDHHAHLIVEELEETLASSVFYIIRPQQSKVLPGYLAWWLNQPQTQAMIAAGARGTGIAYISRRTLEELAVSIPSLSVQGRIGGIMALLRKKKSLQAQLEEKRGQFIDELCRRAIERARARE